MIMWNYLSSFIHSVHCSIFLQILQDGPSASRTLDLASSLDVGSGGSRPPGETELNNYTARSVLTIAFQFTFENHLRDSVAAMARQYVRGVVGSVQRVAMAIAPSRLGSHVGPKLVPGSPEALTLARWICRSYRFHSDPYLNSKRFFFIYLFFIFSHFVNDVWFLPGFTLGRNFCEPILPLAMQCWNNFGTTRMLSCAVPWKQT